MRAALFRAALLAALVLGASTGQAEEPWFKDFRLVKVKPGGKRFFFSHGETSPGCRATEPCPTKAYVVAGDILIAWETATLGRGTTKWIAVEYVSPSGRSTQGWIRDSDLEPFGDPAPPLSAWTGSWKRTEADITMRPGTRPGSIGVSGFATWGSFDPERVRRGGINMGEIEGAFEPTQSHGGFTAGETGSLPFDQGDESDCRVRFRLASPYLLVEDNGNCGGLNVTFSGAYRRQGR